jgi:predicted transcriptional regulator
MLQATPTVMPYRPRPTEIELKVLNSLWCRGATSAKSLAGFHTELTSASVRTRLLRDMQDKDFIAREGSRSNPVYVAIVDEDSVKNSLIELLLEQLFDNSMRVLVLHALSNAELNEDDLSEIRTALREIDQRTKAPKPPREPGLAPH